MPQTFYLVNLFSDIKKFFFSFQKCVTALEKTWHTEHFFCAQCGKQFGEEGFHERDGKPYCREDYFDMFAPKCGGCNRAIMENYISALNSQWHPDCFVCRVGIILAKFTCLITEFYFQRKVYEIVNIFVFFMRVILKIPKSRGKDMRNTIRHIILWQLQDCKNPVSGKSFYAMEGQPVCPKCVGVDDDEEEEEQEA